MSLYNIKSTPQADQFSVTKFDDDLNPESSYILTKGFNGHYGCTCPAAQRSICRHRSMMPMLSLRVDSPFFLDFDTRKWVDPTGTASEASSLVAEIPLRQVQEELYEHETTTKLPDNRRELEESQAIEDLAKTYKPFDFHPFRRRM